MFSSASGSPPATARLYSHRDVTYNCGTCGYALNLSSSNRNTDDIDSKYGKSIRNGVISFDSIDESRFTQSDVLSCFPYFTSGRSCGLIRRRTRLTCRKCGVLIGAAYGTGDGERKRFDVRIGALQPSSAEAGTPLVA